MVACHHSCLLLWEMGRTIATAIRAATIAAPPVPGSFCSLAASATRSRDFLCWATPSSDTFQSARCQQSRQYVTKSGKFEDHKLEVEQLWNNFFGDPLQWRDNRYNKRDPMTPDFVHTTTKDGLWIDDWLNPPWIEARLNSLKKVGDLSCRDTTIPDPNMDSDRASGSSISVIGSQGYCLSAAVVRKLCDEGQLDGAIQAVDLLYHEGDDVYTDIFYCLLQECVKYINIVAGREVHDLIVRKGVEENAFLASHLIRMFTSFGCLLEAKQVFLKLRTPSAFAWSAIISAHAKLGQDEHAAQLYFEMKQASVIPNEYVFVWALKASANTAALARGKLIHADIIESGFESEMLVVNTIIDMYAKCGSLEDARCTFDKQSERDVVTWNALIACFTHNGCVQDAFHLFKQMRKEGMEPNGVTWNAMVAGYAQHGQGQDALQLFQQMQHEGLQPSMATFVSVVQACSSIAALEQGKVIHVQICGSRFNSDVVVGSTLIDMYVKCENLENARSVFDRLGKRDLVIWNAMIAGYAQHGPGHLALQFFQQMHYEGLKPDKFTFVGILKACSKIAAVNEGKQVHAHIIESGLECDVYLGSTLVDMYSKWHSLEDGCTVFEKLPVRNGVTWNAMIAGYAQHSNYRSALQCFENMQCKGLKPDAVTFVCLLSACSHVGLVDEAYRHLKAMNEDYGLTPLMDHYDCMIDILGRAGRLNEAVKLVKTMPFELKITGWRSLLSHCRTHGNVELGKYCFDKVVTKDEKDSACYMLMSTIYAGAGMWHDADKLAEWRESAGAQKKPGMAFIEIDNQVHLFLVGDRSHPRIGDLLSKLKKLRAEMTQICYVPSLD